MAQKTRCYLCPVCGDFFTASDIKEAGGNIQHCLDCNHHYPSESGKCHNCCSKRLIASVPTALTVNQALELTAWSEANGYRRGVSEVYLPDGRRFIGGLPA